MAQWIARAYRKRWLTPFTIVMLCSLVATACSSGDNGPIGDVTDHVELRPLSTSADLRIVDDLDREVLLRGVNLNSLGEYWQGDPEHPPTIPVTDADWDAMATRGISVVRLIITWSLVEPERGEIDQSYLDHVDAAVNEAAAHGIYTVIDMHQDAYSAYIYTEDADECDEGSRPGKGWDGAPEWAVITDGLSTCVTGDRNSAPAVNAAWNNFYDNTDGIRDRFVASWAAVAERFAGRPEVAGYDLLNEPEVSRPDTQLAPLYEELMAETIAAIRSAEADASFEHIVFVEPAIPAGDPNFGLIIPDLARAGIDPTNVVAAPHNYAESIDVGLGLDIEGTNDLFETVGNYLRVPIWVGEYGFWSTSEETLEKVSRYAADEDAHVQGGAWWQWRQGCGDPHSIGWGRPASGTVVHLNLLECPGDVDAGPNEDFLRVLGRAYPRVAPGRITSLVSDPDTGELTLTATGATSGQSLIVWSPTTASTHEMEGIGLEGLRGHSVEGGRIVKASVSNGEYELRITSIAN